MKKQLLTTTALVAAGVLVVSGPALAGKPKLTIGGAVSQIVGVGSNADAYDAANGSRVGFDTHSDGEIHFNGSVTLDNGIKIRTRVELESNSTDEVAGRNSNVINGPPGGTQSGDYIDEHWMRISGSFGEVRLGSHDPAAQAMTTGYLATWNTNVGLNLAFDTSDWVSNPASVGASTVGRIDVTSDAESISYFTPRFSGFQVGVSWTPSAREDVNNQRELEAGADTEARTIGVNYSMKMGGVGVAVAAGYATAEESTANRSNPEIMGGGVRIDFSGIRLSASYVDKNDQTSNGVTAAAGQKTFEVGAKYTMGPNAMSIAHLSAETQATSQATGDGDTAKVTFISYKRTLGPGVSWTLTGIHADFDDGAANATAATSNDGKALVTAINVRF
jgi:outer membrane protein OmpU